MNVVKVGYSISSTLPSNFKADLNVVGCYVKHADKILLLQVCAQKNESNLWGVPAGKIEKNESPKAAVVRELYEETKLMIKSSQVEYFGALYITKPSFSYTFNMFSVITKSTSVVISEEHKAYKWVTFREAFNLPLMFGAKEALVLYKQHQDNVYA